MGATCKKEGKKQQHAKDQQKCIVDLEIKDIAGQIQDVQKIIKGLEEKCLAFTEDSKKKKDLSLLSSAISLKRKAEETVRYEETRRNISVIEEKVI